MELLLQGALLSDLSACKTHFSTDRAFWSCSPVQKVANVAYFLNSCSLDGQTLIF